MYSTVSDMTIIENFNFKNPLNVSDKKQIKNKYRYTYIYIYSYTYTKYITFKRLKITLIFTRISSLGYKGFFFHS